MVKNGFLVMIGGFFLLNAYAQTQPKFIITPATANGNVANISTLGQATLSYQVRNNTDLTRQLTLGFIPGVSLISGSTNNCPNPFTLAPNASCTMTIGINGSQVKSTAIHRGPIVCKTEGAGDNSPSPFLCSQPSVADALNVSIVPAFIYNGSFAEPIVERCFVDSATGKVSDCIDSGAILTTAYPAIGMTLNSSRTLLYVLSYTAPARVTRCVVDKFNGLISDCQATSLSTTATGANQQNIALNPNDSKIYITFAGNNGTDKQIYMCTVNLSTGLVNNDCVASATLGPRAGDGGYFRPIDITINKAGTMAYVSGDYYPNVEPPASTGIVSCSISQSTGLFTTCANLEAPVAGGVTAITLTADQTQLYTLGLDYSDDNLGYISLCNIPSNGVVNSCTPAGPFDFGFGSGLVVNSQKTMAYVAAQRYGQISECPIDTATGLVKTCKNEAQTNVEPHVLALR